MPPDTGLFSNFEATPPEVIAREEAEMALAPHKKRREDLLASLAAVDVKDEEDLRKTLDKVALSRALREQGDGIIAPIVQPYTASQTAVRNVAATFCGPLRQAEMEAERAINAFRARQREAAAQRANAQRAREAELRREAGLVAPAPAAPVRSADVRLESVQSDYRGQAYDRTVKTITVVDVRALPDTILKSAAVLEACRKACAQLAKLTDDIPGATIDRDLKTSVKG